LRPGPSTSSAVERTAKTIATGGINVGTLDACIARLAAS
jgi:hypothetical protein